MERNARSNAAPCKLARSALAALWSCPVPVIPDAAMPDAVISSAGDAAAGAEVLGAELVVCGVASTGDVLAADTVTVRSDGVSAHDRAHRLRHSKNLLFHMGLVSVQCSAC
ncbi:hypothetical protein GCM10017783_01710 [Deinococcus piscis]|uniref:Uncharacterized protein n=1 Tax=Deinococcus piscis TaxID=394230 RepID=A0ABQ3K1N7_9DEIO|nr:hypothetical protein GCM10017783_01710 [Deinococcus piscis]